MWDGAQKFATSNKFPGDFDVAGSRNILLEPLIQRLRKNYASKGIIWKKSKEKEVQMWQIQYVKPSSKRDESLSREKGIGSKKMSEVESTRFCD